ncbi:hypothetical protein QAD02_020393 [Eretmocerus hayati]|uniref:Uncharacterized protein n=1 Tax=Eretmocerus hayati TaxID=131215 RepID=A0ACC2PNK5_9HYME|nr:hypothetical protein QAD02_020393 [Eretmocerus hayati]
MSDCNAESFLKQLAQLFMDQVEKLKNNGPTAKLWLQHYECESLILQFVEAERTADWRLHLLTVRKMIPILYAAGDFAYAKSAQVYLQDMSNLKLSMDPDEFEQFVQGFFTVHRTDEAWSGVWTDMIIEQTLNKFFGMDLKHGRGVSPSVVARFFLGMSSTFAVMESFEEYESVASASSDQHVDLKVGRMKRDQKDLAKFKFWLNQHKPFESRESLISLSTGCDTTSAIFNKGERNVISILKNNVDLQDSIRCFYKQESALQGHVERVYYQIQTWLGKSLDAQLWGWKRKRTMMFPTMTTQPPAPMELLNTISCGCQGNCDITRCSCKKADLPCTRLCKYCNSESCQNVLHEDKNSEEYMIGAENEIYEDLQETSSNCHDEETRSSDDED